MNSNAPFDWRKIFQSETGSGVRVGLLDTGVQSGHPDLQNKVAAHYHITGNANFVTKVGRGRDWNEHGTACAGILSVTAPGAEIHSVQIIGDSPKGTPEKLIAGLRFATEQKWDVINISAGAGRPHKELRDLSEAAWEAGIIVVAAKDNRPDEIGFPAAFPTVLAVDMDHFSKPFALRYDPSSLVEVEANGIYIDAPCAHGGRKLYTGSSFAAPLISGLAARLKSAVPELDPWMFREILAELSEPVMTAAAC